MSDSKPASESRHDHPEGDAPIDFDALNRGIGIAAQLMLDERIKVGEALQRGWREAGIDYASVPHDLKKYPHMFLPGTVERARREGTPVRAGALIPVDTPDPSGS
jgi:hypothetical protein